MYSLFNIKVVKADLEFPDKPGLGIIAKSLSSCIDALETWVQSYVSDYQKTLEKSQFVSIKIPLKLIFEDESDFETVFEYKIYVSALSSPDVRINFGELCRHITKDLDQQNKLATIELNKSGSVNVSWDIVDYYLNIQRPKHSRYYSFKCISWSSRVRLITLLCGYKWTLLATNDAHEHYLYVRDGLDRFHNQLIQNALGGIISTYKNGDRNYWSDYRVEAIYCLIEFYKQHPEFILKFPHHNFNRIAENVAPSLQNEAQQEAMLTLLKFFKEKDLVEALKRADREISLQLTKFRILIEDLEKAVAPQLPKEGSNENQHSTIVAG